jgi:hypothetical protein
MRRSSPASNGKCRGASLDINWDAGLKASESEPTTVPKSFTLRPSQFWGYRPTSSITEAQPVFVSEARRGCIAIRSQKTDFLRSSNPKLDIYRFEKFANSPSTAANIALAFSAVSEGKSLRFFISRRSRQRTLQTAPLLYFKPAAPNAASKRLES